MQDDERSAYERRKWRQVAGHFAMGAVLGAGFAAYLLIANLFNLEKVIATSEAPLVVRALLVIGLSGSFAFCAAITGFLFLVHED